MLIPGDVLDGRYRLDEQIAAGGMGAVWRATDTVLARIVAVKVLLSSLHGDPGFGQRFRAEARTLASLHHPGVIEIYDYGESDVDGRGHRAYLVMPFLDAEPLSDRIASGPLDPAQTISIVAQAAAALHAAHQAGVVHRDVKPANLLIEPDGRVLLVDFGIARAATDLSLTATGQVVGTALYMAPEQITQRDATPSIDIYALGAVAYHCLAGQPPFDGTTALAIAMLHLDGAPQPLPYSVPAGLRELVATAMAKDPADRYRTAAEMADAARAISTRRVATTAAMDGRPIAAAAAVQPHMLRRDTPTALTGRHTQPHPSFISRHRVGSSLAGIALVLGAAAGVMAFADPTGLGPGPGPSGTAAATTAVPTSVRASRTRATATASAKPSISPTRSAAPPSQAPTSSAPQPSEDPPSPTAEAGATGEPQSTQDATG
ncbi:serine/threonine-protein kinase [Allocatelliglobosispora scoriae]|uniref:non-specific serine/threonine protein kinase n=1 Tax=Allocatelliglobosispora scoriae TaxID=643052 RepID=A0A841BIZ5_9ACTN|nr:serine/threonine-protein kinase [Allocatelliglobosispora scoriae]MBB5868234.1 serine/threonine-protein kinase [Allocatelliglobosispora scoriae]